MEPGRSNKDKSSKFIKYTNPNSVSDKEMLAAKPLELNTFVKKVEKRTPTAPSEEIISQSRLKEAIIWNEILGKPVSKRRKSRLR